LIALTREGVTTPYQYDNAGNLLRDDQADYSYDAFNRTTKVETFDGNVQVNRYDAEGLRAEMEENGRLVQFIFNPDKEVVVEMEDGEINRLIRATTLIARNTDAVRMYYHYASDEMGSTTHILDEAGQVLNRYEYDAWGNVTEQEESIPNRFKFTGQQLDPVTQQYYLRARFYNPVIGRFTQEDVYRGDGLNLYAYCHNNPVFYIDPSGYFTQCQKDAYDRYRQEGMTAAEAYQAAMGKVGVKPEAMTDRQIEMAANTIHEAQYGDNWWGNRNPVAVTVTADGTVVVTKNNGVIGPNSRDAATQLFGDNVVIPSGRGQNYDNTAGGPYTPAPNHAEARGIQGAINTGANSTGARQATTLPSCPDCTRLQREYGINNLTGISKNQNR